MATVHIIGSGISGLAAATALSAAHIPVKLYEAAAHAGGRCRSSTDRELGRIDHGLHLFSGAARELWRFIDRIDSRAHFMPLPAPWRVHDGQEELSLGGGALPTVPLADIARLVTALAVPGGQRLGDHLPEESPLYDQLLVPLARLGLHRPPHEASARQLRALLARQLRRGGAHWFTARDSLQESFIAPALAAIDYQGGSVYFGQALTGLIHDETGVRQLNFARKKLLLDAEDVVILATPAPVSKHMLPTLAIPPAQHTSITLHFAADHREPVGTLRVLTRQPTDLLRYDAGAIRAMLRLANHVWHSDDTLLAARVWRCIRQLHPYLPADPLWAIRREKRAGHVPLDAKLPAPTLPPRLLLAGDWLDATQPATLEAAAASGHHAAEAAAMLLGRHPLRQQGA
jgi:hypothetical protein